MSESKFIKANKKIEEAVVGGYKKIENAVVSCYTKVEDKFVESFLIKFHSLVQPRCIKRAMRNSFYFHTILL